MGLRPLASVGVLATLIAVVSLASVPVAGQAQTATADTWTPLQTPWGEPDLQGIWDYRTITPMQRSRQLAGKEYFTEEEAAERERRAVERNERLGDISIRSEDRGTQVASVRGTKRTSLIVDPPDGRIPSLIPPAQERLEARTARRQRPPQDPEDLTLVARCLVRGPPMVPFGGNNYMHLFQSPGYVAILSELLYEARIIPLDGRPHVPDRIPQWMGNSRGHWDGETLVVDTTNFTGSSGVRGSNRPKETSHLIERFTRVGTNTLLYEFTLDDPTWWTRPWSAVLPMAKTEGPMFEYACHEGNYDLAIILSGALAAEKLPTIEVRGVDFVDAGAAVPLVADAAAHGGARVERVEFVVDGSVVRVDREAPYEVTWTAGGTGRHLVTASVHDSEGRVAESVPVAVFVGLRALERSIARSEDDAEEPSSASLTSGDLDLVSVVGLRFTEIRIPRGAQIEQAYVQFTAQGVHTAPTDVIIQAELAANARPFRWVTNLASRTRTAASVHWSPEPWEVVGERSVRQRTSDLAALIQEVVDRPDWNEGNALVLLMSGSRNRSARSFDGARARRGLEHAPRLYIELAEQSP